jgi:hypothetical protein
MTIPAVPIALHRWSTRTPGGTALTSRRPPRQRGGPISRGALRRNPPVIRCTQAIVIRTLAAFRAAAGVEVVDAAATWSRYTPGDDRTNAAAALRQAEAFRSIDH